MKATILFAVLGGLLTIPGSAWATHVDCGDVITEDTTLDSDLFCRDFDEQTAVTIGADDITLNLNGHRIAMQCDDLSTSVKNEGHHGVKVENGYLSGYYPARLSDATGNLLRNVTANACVEAPAIWLIRSHGNRIEGSRARTYRGTGISLTDSERNVLEENVLRGNGEGIGLYRSHRNRVVENRGFHNDRSGISLNGSHGNQISRNSMLRTADHRCRCGRGIVMIASHGNWLKENTVFQNQLDGVVLLGSDQNRLTKNLAFDSGRFDGLADGFFIDGFSEGTVFRRNVASRNSDDGIDTDNADTTLAKNTANRNGDLGIEAVPGVNDRGGNRASGNGSPAQCSNVACE